MITVDTPIVLPFIIATATRPTVGLRTNGAQDDDCCECAHELHNVMLNATDAGDPPEAVFSRLDRAKKAPPCSGDGQTALTFENKKGTILRFESTRQS
jgi:hypothetical protein